MSAPDGSRVEALWESLAPHVEWPEGFSLVFLFAGHPGPVGELRERLERSLQQRSKALVVLDPASPKEVKALAPVIVTKPEDGHGALWVSLLQRAGAPGWERAIRELLYRLNERRFLLERDLAVPMVMVLPLELRLKVYEIAPDLWTVRSFAEQVPGPEVTRSETMPRPREAESGPKTTGSFGSPGRAELEWARLLCVGDRRRLAVMDGHSASHAALERGDVRAARRIALEALAVGLSQSGIEVEDMSDFDVAAALTKADPHTAGAQRRLSRSMSVLGEVELQAGNISAARDLFLRVLRIEEALADDAPHDPIARHELFVALARLGHAELELGEISAARDLFLRSVQHAESLADAHPHDPGIQRGFCASLHGLGDIEMKAGNASVARDCFLRALEWAEKLGEAYPHDPQHQRNLAVSLHKLGHLELQAGNLSAARELFLRSLLIAEALSNADSHDAVAGTHVLDARASFDVAYLHDRLARLAEQHGDRTTELVHLHEAREILEAMDARGQLAGFAEREQLRDEITRRIA